ncbi:MAG: TlpA family protein disulfide reductase [Candidatus Hydrogenedentes bacterium]|nr:TlpA family protein disulfide reductase [Candidatus Hydrogenedentota bacterium]
MRRPGKSFLAGCLAGFVLGPLLVGLVVAGVLLAFQKPISRALAARQEERLRAADALQGKQAQLDWEVKTLEGARVVMSGFKGRPLFLHFWNPSCTSCLAELSSISRLHEALDGSGVEMVTVIKADDEAVADLQPLAVTFPVYLAGGERPEMFKTPSLPTTFLLNAAGQVVYAHTGSARWDDPALIAFIKALPSLTGPAESGSTGGA